MNNTSTLRALKKGRLREATVKVIFMVAACVSILAVALICLFIFANGVPAIGKIGTLEFLLGKEWRPGSDKFGIFPMIIGSIYVTGGAIIVGVPIGILMAVFMAHFCPSRVYRVVKPFVELLAGIPSVVYGFIGLQLLVPLIHSYFPEERSGKGVLAASIMLGIMILPTIINVSESALRAVPDHYYEGALALGATHERSVFFTVLPAAKSGVLASVILGVGRAIGETMAVVWVAGNSAIIPDRLLSNVRTLTTNIVMEMGYATDLHREALFGTAVILFVFILIINLCFSFVKRRSNL